MDRPLSVEDLLDLYTLARQRLADARRWLLSTNSLSERIMASPAVTGNWLIYRTDSHLYCVGKGPGR
jgi:hypothetical protein